MGFCVMQESNNWVPGECEKPDNLSAPCPAGEGHAHEGSMNEQAYSWDTQASSISQRVFDELDLELVSETSFTAESLCDSLLVAEDVVNKSQHLCPAPQLTEDWPQHSYLLSWCCSLPTSEKGEAKMNPPFLEPGYLGRSLWKCKLQLIFLLQCPDQPIS